MSEKKTGLELLREPFPPNQISLLPKPTKNKEEMAKIPKGKCKECGGWHATTNVIHLSYVGHAALTDRLLDADPKWFWEPLALKDGLPSHDPSGGLWIRLTVCGTTRLGYGHAGEKRGGDAVKEVIGDALRNAAMRFGAALELWHKGELHTDDEDEPERQKAFETPHKPTDGAWESMAPDVRIFLSDLSGEVRGLLNKGDMHGAAQHINDQGLDNDQKTALWTRFDSKERAALKKAFEEIRQKEAA